MKKIMLVAALVFAVTLSGFAQDESMLSRDDILEADIARTIGNNVYYSIYDIVNVQVNEGVVRLSGYVTEPHKRASILKQVSEMPDVKAVEESITVLPPSVNDDRLRFIIARKIYGDSRLMKYAFERWPYPIHIIVKNGRVTLEGEIKNKFDNRLIEVKVRETFGVLEVDNNLRVS